MSLNTISNASYGITTSLLFPQNENPRFNFERSLNDFIPREIAKSQSKEFFKQLKKISRIKRGNFSNLTTVLENASHLQCNVSKRQILRQAMQKESGYLKRLFSEETWSEWLEPKTALGQVFSLYADCIESTTKIKNFIKRLDQQIVQNAANEASRLLQKLDGPCMTSLVGGLAGSTLTQNPWPVLLGAVGCLPKATSQEVIASEFQINAYWNNTQVNPSLTRLGNNRFVAAWDSLDQVDNFDIFYQILNELGEKIGPERLLNNYTVDSQRYSSLANLSDGNFVGVWQSNGQIDANDIFGQLLNPTGDPIGSEILVNQITTDEQKFPEVASLSNGGFVVVWHSYGAVGSNGAEVMGRLFANDFSPITDAFQINTEVINSQWSPKVAALDTGGFSVIWISDNQDGSGTGVYGKTFNKNGEAISPEFRLNQYIDSDQRNLEIFAIDNGRFVCVWTSYGGQDGSLAGVYMRIFDQNGQPLTDEILVNDNILNNQSGPTGTHLGNGKFLVSWDSEEGYSGYEVMAAIFDGNGNKLAGDFLVNNYTNLTQYYSSATKINNNDFVIVWSSDGQDGSDWGVFGKIYRYFTQPTTGTTAPFANSTSGVTTGNISNTSGNNRTTGTTQAVTTLTSSIGATGLTATVGSTTFFGTTGAMLASSSSSMSTLVFLGPLLGGIAIGGFLGFAGYYLYRKRCLSLKEEVSLPEEHEMKTKKNHSIEDSKNYLNLNEIQPPEKEQYFNIGLVHEYAEGDIESSSSSQEGQYQNLPVKIE